jgi:hypothetical protein
VWSVETGLKRGGRCADNQVHARNNQYRVIICSMVMVLQVLDG